MCSPFTFVSVLFPPQPSSQKTARSGSQFHYPISIPLPTTKGTTYFPSYLYSIFICILLGHRQDKEAG